MCLIQCKYLCRRRLVHAGPLVIVPELVGKYPRPEPSEHLLQALRCLAHDNGIARSAATEGFGNVGGHEKART